jgi:hypothetical protein
MGGAYEGRRAATRVVVARGATGAVGPDQRGTPVRRRSRTSRPAVAEGGLRYVRMHYGDAQVPLNHHRHTLGTWAAWIGTTYGTRAVVVALSVLAARLTESG